MAHIEFGWLQPYPRDVQFRLEEVMLAKDGFRV